MEYLAYISIQLAVCFLAAVVSHPTLLPLDEIRERGKPFNCPICLGFWGGCGVGVVCVFVSPELAVCSPVVSSLGALWMYRFLLGE